MGAGRFVCCDPNIVVWRLISLLKCLKFIIISYEVQEYILATFVIMNIYFCYASQMEISISKWYISVRQEKSTFLFQREFIHYSLCSNYITKIN